MSVKQKIVIAFSLIFGIATAGLGLWLLADYVGEIASALRSSDQSFLFWGIPVLVISIGTIVLGATMVISAALALKRPTVYPFVRILLIIYIVLFAFGTILVVSNERSAKRGRTNATTTEAFIASLNKISDISIGSPNTHGFDVIIDTTGGHDGAYTLAVTISTNQTKLYDISKPLLLESDSKKITETIAYRDLFARCRSDLAGSSGVYVCVNNAGTDATFKVEATLTYMTDLQDPVKLSQDLLDFERSAATARFGAETFTSNNEVTVKDFKVLE